MKALKKFVIGYFYSDLLNLYGDNGNVEILVSRCMQRGIDVEVNYFNVNDKLDSLKLSKLNFIFMGGGPDESQKNMYLDLLKNKGAYIKEFIENGGLGMFICGSYQLFGNYYKSADGSILQGLSIFNIFTQNFGAAKPRCVGNLVVQLDNVLLNDAYFKNVNKVGNTLVGFENHGGRTYFEDDTLMGLGTVRVGFGNNGEDLKEGLLYKNVVGTYLHGPIFSKNPHLADFFIAKSLQLETLKPLDDALIIEAHKKCLLLKN